MITLEKPIISRDSDTKAFTIDMAPTVNNSKHPETAIDQGKPLLVKS